MIFFADASTLFGQKCLVAGFERRIELGEQSVRLSDPGSFLIVNRLH